MLTADDLQMMQDVLGGSPSEPGLLGDRVTIRRGDVVNGVTRAPFDQIVARNVPCDVATISSERSADLNNYVRSINIGFQAYRLITLPASSGMWQGDRLFKEPAGVTISLGAVGNFTVSVGGQTTGPLASTSSAAALQAALQALSTVGAGKAFVTGPNGGPWFMSFDKSLGAPYVSLSGTASPSLVYGTSVYGVRQYSPDETNPVLVQADCEALFGEVS